MRKAFPTVCRELLFQKLSQKCGAPDSLVRALWALYDEAQGTVRGAQGFGTPFNIEVGTREGGVESPLLYILFVCDLTARFDAALLAASPKPPTVAPEVAAVMAPTMTVPPTAPPGSLPPVTPLGPVPADRNGA